MKSIKLYIIVFFNFNIWFLLFIVFLILILKEEFYKFWIVLKKFDMLKENLIT